jgi:hypothetical protein
VVKTLARWGCGPVGLVHTHGGRIKYKKPLCQGSLRMHIFENFSEVGGWSNL